MWISVIIFPARVVARKEVVGKAQAAAELGRRRRAAMDSPGPSDYSGDAEHFLTILGDSTPSQAPTEIAGGSAARGSCRTRSGASPGHFPSPSGRTPTSRRPPASGSARGSPAHLPSPSGRTPRSKRPRVEEDDENPVPEGSRATLADEAITFIRRRLLGGDAEGYPEEDEQEDVAKLHATLVDTLNSTVRQGYNNSAILQGTRGTGKSWVLERALEEVSSDDKYHVIVVRLSGVVHSDDKRAMKEIAKQLTEDAQSRMSDGREVEQTIKASYEGNISFVKGLMKECERNHRAIVFVLEEFDLFCPPRTRQTVLYTLLDAMHSSKVQACVVGLSTRQDAVEMLEKRVRSRFSHRRLVFKSVPVLQGIKRLEGLLRLPTSGPGAFKAPRFAAQYNNALASAIKDPRVHEALAGGGGVMRQGTSYQRAVDIAFGAIIRMERGEGDVALTPECFLGACEDLQVDPAAAMLEGVGKVEMEVLVVMCRLEQRERDAFNFEMVFSEYEALTCTSGAGGEAEQQTRQDVMRAFESLQALELVVGHGKPGAGLKEYQVVNKAVGQRDVEAALGVHPLCGAHVKLWLKMA